jgi:hypothetical protein
VAAVVSDAGEDNGGSQPRLRAAADTEAVMTSNRRFDFPIATSPAFAEEHRKAMQHAQEERLAQRQRELERQRAPSEEPRLRVATWERLHALSLPAVADHPLVRVIARHTGLSIADVQHEQARRAELNAP